MGRLRHGTARPSGQEVGYSARSRPAYLGGSASLSSYAGGIGSGQPLAGALTFPPTRRKKFYASTLS